MIVYAGSARLLFVLGAVLFVTSLCPLGIDNYSKNDTELCPMV